MKQYKRQWRELSNETKGKISQSSKNKPKSAAHKEHISQSLTDYWRSVPHKPGNEDISMDDFLGIINKGGDER